jgi:hypothetical protein
VDCSKFTKVIKRRKKMIFDWLKAFAKRIHKRLFKVTLSKNWNPIHKENEVFFLYTNEPPTQEVS